MFEKLKFIQHSDFINGIHFQARHIFNNRYTISIIKRSNIDNEYEVGFLKKGRLMDVNDAKNIGFLDQIEEFCNQNRVEEIMQHLSKLPSILSKSNFKSYHLH